jgi:ribosomal protein S12 methylthiotransferase
MYAHPAHVTPGLIKIIGRTPKILKYLDLPLQHICDKILKKMGRRYLRLQVEKLIHDLRRLVPSIALRTTVMVGFPGESEKDFNELLEFITKYKFERLGVFKYSREEGTPANKMRGQVPEKVKESRFHQIMQRQNMIAKNFNRGLLNKIFEVLVDQGVAGGAVGRTYLDAPEIDGSVFIKNVRLHPGRLVKAKISGYSSYDLSARLVT